MNFHIEAGHISGVARDKLSFKLFSNKMYRHSGKPANPNTGIVHAHENICILSSYCSTNHDIYKIPLMNDSDLQNGSKYVVKYGYFLFYLKGFQHRGGPPLLFPNSEKKQFYTIKQDRV